ncbi:MAG TPA: hypothetical protein VF538_06110 [Pyrinomonadaceae bacterium]|jgi:hypothetical protein
MKRLLLLGVAALLLAGSTDALAQGHRHVRYNDRQDRQRVRRGIRSGQITRDEARQIRERERQIRAGRRAYRSDGTITRDERRDLRRDERVQDRFIRRQRRDDDRRRGNGYYRRGAGSPGHPVFGRRNRY